MRSGASKSSKLRGLLDALDALDGMDVVKVLSRRDRQCRRANRGSCRSRAASGRYVVIPLGGGGVSVISLARIGVQCSGGQRLAKMHAMRPSGRAALGASNPAQPSRQSASPMSW